MNGPGVEAFTAPEHQLSTCTSWPSWAKSRADQRVVVRSSSRRISRIRSLPCWLPTIAPSAKPGVGRYGDQPALAQHRHRLGDGPGLRVDRVHVEVAGHAPTIGVTATPGSGQGPAGAGNVRA